MSRKTITGMRKQIMKTVKVFGRERHFAFLKPCTKDILLVQNKVAKTLITLLPGLIPEGRNLSEMTGEDLAKAMEGMDESKLIQNLCGAVSRIDDNDFMWIAETLLNEANVDGFDINDLETSEYFEENPTDIYVCLAVALSSVLKLGFLKGLKERKDASAPIPDVES